MGSAERRGQQSRAEQSRYEIRVAFVCGVESLTRRETCSSLPQYIHPSHRSHRSLASKFYVIGPPVRHATQNPLPSTRCPSALLAARSSHAAPRPRTCTFVFFLSLVPMCASSGRARLLFLFLSLHPTRSLACSLARSLCRASRRAPAHACASRFLDKTVHNILTALRTGVVRCHHARAPACNVLVIDRGTDCHKKCKKELILARCYSYLLLLYCTTTH